MKVTTETLPERQVKLQIEVDDDRHHQAIETAYKKLAPRVQIPGFRPGKAPRPLIEKQLGRHRLLDEAMELLVPQVYKEVLEEQDIDPVAQPSVELVSHEPLVFTATVPLQPVVDIGDYQALRLPREELTVDDAQVEESIDELRRRYGTIEPVDREAAAGDVLRADIKATIGDDSLFAADDIEFRVTDEALSSLPGLTEILIGMKKGDDVTKTADVAADFSDERMAGQTVTYHVKLHEVKEEKLAELNDEFAKEIGEGFETLLALRARIREDIQKAQEERALSDYQTAAVDALAERATLEYAPVMLEHEIDHILEDQANLDPRDPRSQMIYLQRLNKTEQEVRESVREEAEQRMRRSLVLSQFAAAEDITVEDADIDAEIDTMAASSGEQGDMIRQLFGNEGARDSLSRSLLTRKTLARLVEIAGQTDEPEAEQKPAKQRRSGPRKAAGEGQAPEATETTDAEASSEASPEASNE
ncbi:MAG TPA: trigger factor [Dehalococcoidia bacterium]|nr:trigger factor [Dehalococcoidia bacterium]